MSERLRVNMISETTFTVRGHGVHTAFLETTRSLADRSDVDVKVNSFRKADNIHIQTIGPYALLHILFGRGKKIISAHVVPDSFVGSLAFAEYLHAPAMWYLRFFYNRADCVLAVSPEVGDYITRELGVKVPVEVHFNTVDTAAYKPTAAGRVAARRSLGLPDGRFTVVSNGQIQPRKRYDVMVELAKAHPDWQFIWVGGMNFSRFGAEYAAMHDLIRQAPPNLLTTGVIELAAVKRYFWAGDAFVLPSNQENHPLAVLEAAAAGLPVVVRDLPEYNSSFGHDVLRGDDDTFGPILERLRTDPGYRHQALTGSARIALRFDNVANGENLVASYRRSLTILGGHS